MGHTNYTMSSRAGDAIAYEQAASKQEKFFEPTPLEGDKNKRAACSSKSMMCITVDAAAVAKLRSIIVCTCGDLVTYIRVKPVEHACKMKVWLCLSEMSVDAVMSNIMHILPEAEFGKITAMSVN
jgi:hypothetical protein